VALLCIAAMNLLIKAGARAMEGQQQVGASLSLLSMVKTALVNPWIIGGMICGILNFATYTFALKKFQVSTAYPIMVSVSYVIIVFGAAVWFSERLKTLQMVGMGLILAGVWMVASGMAKTG
jgi:multidrug transporter EmrE-like cation transporter